MDDKTMKNPTKLNQLLISSPLRVFSKFKKFCFKSMALCEAQIGGYGGGGAFGCPGYCPTVIPRSFSVNNNYVSHDTNVEKEGSGRRRMSKTYDELQKRTSCGGPAAAGGVKRAVMSRSYSVGVVRIDEDEVCEFGDDVMVRTRSLCMNPDITKKRYVAH